MTEEVRSMNDMGTESVAIKISRCRPDARLPAYARPGDAGMDVMAAEDTLIAPGETTLVPTGIRVAIPEGYELQVRPRSGISLNTPLRIPNSPGTIDSGFRDEVRILLTNTSPEGRPHDDPAQAFRITEKGRKAGPYLIRKGDRIAQLVLARVPTVCWVEVDSVENEGVDRLGGFGSTGVD
jgi:dUTP pyrophosphatase